MLLPELELWKMPFEKLPKCDLRLSSVFTQNSSLVKSLGKCPVKHRPWIRSTPHTVIHGHETKTLGLTAAFFARWHPLGHM